VIGGAGPRAVPVFVLVDRDGHGDTPQASPRRGAREAGILAASEINSNETA